MFFKPEKLDNRQPKRKPAALIEQANKAA